ncbi:hypothetical protein CQW23_09672 [Capsicum baccatum]|uniref:Uncharacterized protein n=1 Tax=Capsicum baccatum TaxID=33114 RepID=A0A2G2WXH7_CAPBA|nr:hypothetical protein CQW23_35240 [Capsicum baccatum]PHT49925.1 hypothetical protein CQW23_09672 [Capsicum baccatum]
MGKIAQKVDQFMLMKPAPDSKVEMKTNLHLILKSKTRFQLTNSHVKATVKNTSKPVSKAESEVGKSDSKDLPENISSNKQVKKSEDLDCASSDVVISYLMHSREKVNPTIINNDVCVLIYMMDADADGFRPILRINIVERSFEGTLNSSPPSPRRPTVDDDLIDDDLNN